MACCAQHRVRGAAARKHGALLAAARQRGAIRRKLSRL
jgi:hypothetical protein